MMFGFCAGVVCVIDDTDTPVMTPAHRIKQAATHHVYDVWFPFAGVISGLRQCFVEWIQSNLVPCSASMNILACACEFAKEYTQENENHNVLRCFS